MVLPRKYLITRFYNGNCPPVVELLGLAMRKRSRLFYFNNCKD